MGSKAFESPLISHVRMRAMFRALVEVRALAAAHRDRGVRGVEACWVGSAIGLAEGDLTVGAGGAHDGAMLGLIRGVGQRATAGAISASEFKKLLRGSESELSQASAPERAWRAIGMADALKQTRPGALIVAYVLRSELKGAEWKRLLAAVGEVALPLIVVALPGVRDTDDLSAFVRAGKVPVIPVDAGDAVALYRVTQETIVRARAGGGTAIIDGVNCGVDAVKLLGSQLVSKGICTERWVETAASRAARLNAKNVTV